MNRKRNNLLIISAFLIFNFSFLIVSFAQTVRYVSKTGNATPPYTSWETASDSIQKCINICEFGDTVYVGSGTYEEQIVMIPGLSLIGTGMDSCVIDTRSFFEQTDFYTITMGDSCLVTGFCIKVANGQTGTGIMTDFYTQSLKTIEIRNNKFTRAGNCIYITDADAIVYNNIFTASDYGVRLGNVFVTFSAKVNNNIFTHLTGSGLSITIGDLKLKAIDNLFLLNSSYSDAYYGSLSDSVFLKNNTVIGIDDSWIGFGLSNIPTIIENNTIVGEIDYGIWSGEPSRIINNNIYLDGGVGIVFNAGQSPEVHYNNFWNCSVSNYDSTNIAEYPMFVKDDPDDYDFHLQKYSPLIDAGDPEIWDKDRTRSDIGHFGGPLGEYYTYYDIAPKIPDITYLSANQDSVRLYWTMNYESDFKKYKLYRDSIPTFETSEDKLIAELDTTYFIESTPQMNAVYYRVSAIDNQGNESEGSNPKGDVLVGIQAIEYKTTDFKLFQNYPNPFNSTTNIGYRIIKPSNVRIAVYNIVGELIEEALNEHKAPGYYEIKYNLKNPQTLEGLAAGIYLYRIEIKDEKGRMIYSDMKKMVYLK